LLFGQLQLHSPGATGAQITDSVQRVWFSASFAGPANERFKAAVEIVQRGRRSIGSKFVYFERHVGKPGRGAALFSKLADFVAEC
jgi:hypothetical protein